MVVDGKTGLYTQNPPMSEIGIFQQLGYLAKQPEAQYNCRERHVLVALVITNGRRKAPALAVARSSGYSRGVLGIPKAGLDLG
jgi:hypothetical protein